MPIQKNPLSLEDYEEFGTVLASIHTQLAYIQARVADSAPMHRGPGAVRYRAACKAVNAVNLLRLTLESGYSSDFPEESRPGFFRNRDGVRMTLPASVDLDPDVRGA